MLGDAMEVDGKFLKLERGALWSLLFYHDLNKATYFSSKSEALECNEEGKFSVLSRLSSKYKINNKYEFIIEYPELNETNQWRQSLNPLHQPHNNGDNATGYEEIDVQMSINYFGGLFYFSGNNVCLLKGSTNEWWHYAIGTISKEFDPCFPGPGTSSKIVKLWVRMPTSLSKASCKIFKSGINFKFAFHTFILSIL